MSLKLIQPITRESGISSQAAFERLKDLGDCHASVGNHGQAERCYREAALLEPSRPDPYVGLGVVAMQAGEYDDALLAFQTAQQLDAHCLGAYAGAAMLYQEQGRHAKAFEMYLRCLEIDPNNLMALLGLFQASCRMGTFAKIIYYLEVYLASHPSDHAVLFCLATLYAREGQDIAARQALLAVLAAEPDKTDALELLHEVDQRLQCQQEVA